MLVRCILDERLRVIRNRHRHEGVPLRLRFAAEGTRKLQLPCCIVVLLLAGQRLIAVLCRAAAQQQFGTARKRVGGRQVVLIHAAERFVGRGDRCESACADHEDKQHKDTGGESQARSDG
jgi:hypothetical protein